KIQAGHFEFEGALSPKDFLETLAKGSTVTFSVTLIEGKTLSNWLDQLWEAKHLRREIPKELSSREAYPLISKILKLSTDSPEGWFYPDTYRYSVGDSEMSILLRAHLRMKASLDEAWANRQKDIPLKSAYEALILASIIEKETGAKNERAQISGVFMRRLNKKMRLQTDPTVIYGQGENFSGNLKRVHLREANDYNTYMIPGLPPTPIALPSQAAVEAAVNPADGTAIFFVSRGDGTHVFSETLEQHNQAVREFQLRISK
ncbi:MAG: endolytic transglycosylase MltG, partial [Pseudomonadota bacterium]